MIALEIYRYINATISTRPTVFTDEHLLAADRLRSFEHGGCRTHVIWDYQLCKAILSNRSFVQPDIADALDTVLAVGPDKSVLSDGFLRANPIDANGRDHADLRKKFMTAFAEAQAFITPLLPKLAEEVFQQAIRNSEIPIVQHVASPYVDAAISLILEKQTGTRISSETWSGSSACIFEYFHSRSQLKDKEREIRQFQSALLHSGSTGDLAIALSYVLQGRDPLIGALTSVCYKLAALPDEQRELTVKALEPRALFAGTAPVHYIGRTASEDCIIMGNSFSRRDRFILMLPWAYDQQVPAPKNRLTFGAGAHICAGQALALELAAPWIAALQKNHASLAWQRSESVRTLPSVFLQFGEAQ
jgi:cytochrome P450